MQTLYCDAKSSVLNKLIPPLTIMPTSCGDPVAGYIFILILEVPLNKIRHQIPFLNAKNFLVGCIAFADDMTVLLRTSADLQRLLRIVNNFAPISGLQINQDKSEVLEMGVSALGCGLAIKTQLTITGIVFSTNRATMRDVNWRGLLHQDKA
jgi:hypothetical protein